MRARSPTSLRRNGFEVEVAENLTKEAMQRAIERLYGKIKNGTSAVFFFSGYGIQTGRQTYLIPVNAQIWTEAEVRRDGIGIDTVLAELNARGATVKVAILDASRRNPFERRFRGLSAGLAPVTAPRGTLVISAAAPGTVVNDTTDENSLFVRELLKEMRSPNLTIEEVFNRTRIGVSRASKGEQVPWISSSLVEDFYLAKAPRPARRRATTAIRRVASPTARAQPDRRAIARPTSGATTTSPTGSAPRRAGRTSWPSTRPGSMRTRRATSSPSSTRARPRSDRPEPRPQLTGAAAGTPGRSPRPQQTPDRAVRSHRPPTIP